MAARPGVAPAEIDHSEKFIVARPRFTSASIRRDAMGTPAYQGQTVSDEWQS